MISRIEMILLDVHIIADDLSNTFSFPVTRHKSLLVQILKILKFENLKIILKRHLNHDFPNRNDSFGCHVFSDDLSNTFFISRYAAQVFACSNFKDFKIEIWKF